MKGSFKRAAVTLTAVVMISLASSSSCANQIEAGQAPQSKWVQQQNIWYYQNEKGENYTGWLSENNCWYYLNLDGKMATGWLNENGSWYCLDTNGKMKTGWLSENNYWYYLNPDGKMVTGWLNENGNWYCLDTNGKMKTGWLSENNCWYYLNPDGKMATGWLNENGNWYCLDANGKMKTGWLSENNCWYYLNPDGKMATGWLNENGSWYYLTSDGKMVTGWLEQNGVWYYLCDDGKMAVNTWIASNYVDANGVLVENPNNRPPENVLESTESTENTESADSTKPNEFIENTENTEFTGNHMGSEITPEYIMQSLENLKAKYPDGMYWNHMGYAAKQKDTNYYSETVTSIPCNHGLYGTNYCNSYINDSLAYIIGVQCDGFARKLSDEIFGTSAKKTDYTYQFDAVKVGDYLRYNNVHTVLVIGKDENGILVAECNIGGTCVIRWGRRITRSDLDRSRSITCFTRY